MASHTITAMFNSRADADRAAASVRQNTALTGATVRVLPEGDGETTTTTTSAHEDTGFLASLRNFFMPEEDRYGYAEGMRRGSYMVAVDTDEAHATQVMDLLEQAGAVDLDEQEAHWRQEGWRGYEPSSSATAGSSATTGSSTTTGAFSETPAAFGTTGTGMGTGGTAATTGTGTGISGTPVTTGSTATTTGETDIPPMPANVGRTGATGTTATGTGATGTGTARAGTTGVGTEERIPLAEETLRVGKRQVVEGRVRIRSYVVETPVEETVHLRDERVEVERRPVDRPISGEADPFRERELEATETREEAVVSKDARIREELVMRRSAEERDETIKDTVRRTEVREDRGDDTDVTRDPGTTSGTTPGTTRTP
jgi:uncharacterized protein (TIGR02271 family)